jgi:hypothetical protein
MYAKVTVRIVREVFQKFVDMRLCTSQKFIFKMLCKCYCYDEGKNTI